MLHNIFNKLPPQTVFLHCNFDSDFQVALDFATHLGMKSVSYEVIETARAEERMEKVRRDAGYEGEVLYFLDARDNVIGLLKKKTAWYVVLR